MSEWEYVLIEKELPPIGKKVRVIPWKMNIWLDQNTSINFKKKKKHYGSLTTVIKSGLKYEYIWVIEGINGHRLPLRAISKWKKEIFKSIEDRFEILDL